jgi:hypothetical protein
MTAFSQNLKFVRVISFLIALPAVTLNLIMFYYANIPEIE